MTRPAPTATRSVTLTRIVDAPRARVFRAWIEPARIAQWWGPHGFSNPRCELDPKPGGKIHIDMRAPDGTIYPMTGTFHEVVEPERLVFTAVAEDHEGNAHLESRTIVTFEALGEKTKITVQAEATGFSPAAPQMLSGMDAGWTQSLERLADAAGGAA